MIKQNLKVPKTMKGAVLWETGKPLSIENKILIPELNNGQVLIKIAFSGVCRSQLMEVRGYRGIDNYLPHLLGHEGCGQVVSIGKNVKKVGVGDWVILGWIKGRGINSKGAIYRIDNHKINSGPVTTFSTYSVVSENRVVKLPKSLPKDIAVLFGCALPTGAGMVLNQIKPKRNSMIAIFGLGGIGLSSLIACNHFNLSKVIAIDISNEKLEIAKYFGATHTINPKIQSIRKVIQEITNGNGVDYAIESAGYTKTIESAFDLVKINGGKCFFASHPKKGDKIKIDPFDLISGKNIYGSWGGGCKPDKDIPLLATMYNEGKLPLDKLITKKYTLDEINLALNDLENLNVFRPLIVF